MPKHTTITDAAAQKFKAAGDRVDHFDSSHPGLALRVSKTGVKAWTYFYRLVNGKVHQRRMTLGLYPSMSVAEAHDAWRKARDLVQAGRDPAVTDTKLPPMSFEGVFEEWIRRDATKKDGTPKRSIGLIAQRLRKEVVPAWKGRLITDIDKRACLSVIEEIADSGRPVLANRIQAHLHRMFVWCIGRDILEKNPLHGVEFSGVETSRSRVLSDDELAKVWQASESLLLPYRAALRLLILTGARRQEIGSLRWEETDGKVIELSGERTKTGTQHIIMLSSPARAILAEVERKSDFVFTTAQNGGGIINWARLKVRLDEASGVTGWTIHDLRRTVATGLQRLGVALPVTEAILGHTGGSRGGIVGVYQRHDYAAEKASALEAWGAHITALVTGSKRGEVVALRRG